MPAPIENFSKIYRVEFDKQATHESLMAVIKEILGRSGCAQCGRLGRFELEFDPRVQLEREIPGIREITESIKTGAIR